MTNQKDRKSYKSVEKEKDFSEPVHSWLDQYGEEDDFLSGRVSNSLSEFAEEK